MLKYISNIFGGNKSEKDIQVIMPLVEKVIKAYSGLQQLSHDELRNKSNEFRERIKQHLKEIDDQIDKLKSEVESEKVEDVFEKEDIYKEIDQLILKRDENLEEVLLEILPEAFAVVKEVAKRFYDNETVEVTATELDKELSTQKENVVIQGDKAIHHTTWLVAGNETRWDMIHYDVQLVGGIVLHEGKIAEMATGEGKTLAATLPSYLNALSGQGVHIVTVNDYLAKRDAEWMGPILEFLGITVDCIDKYKAHSPERRKAYMAGVTYGTNNEFGFDYLRDNMVQSPTEKVQRKLHYSMVDEVDSVLVDDARTPLIISGPVPKGDEQEFHSLKPRIQRLVDAQKKVVLGFLNEAKKMISEDKAGESDGGLALLRAFRGLPKNKATIKYLSEPGIKVILNKIESVYMAEQNKRMPEVDVELFFVIDEKNNSVELTEKGIELITGEGEDPNFFVMPDVGGEIAEIEKSDQSDKEKLASKDKLLQDFAIKSERVHAIQQLLKAYSLFEIDVEYVVMDGKVKIVDEQTGRILEGRRYSDGLHQAIEAKENVKVEAATQTFATITLQNYFRMYHKLSGMTGTAETEAGELWEIYKLDVVVIPTNEPIVRDDREDLVYRTAREKYKAVINEIVDLTNNNRPVLVGTTSVEVSELLSRMLKLQSIKHNVLNAKQHQREAEIIAEAGNPKSVTIATNMAGRGTDIKLGQGVQDGGGLAIIGTERHESRRVDRQLRGRSGRQGDPGSSQFFVSLEDNLMRLFGSDRIAKLMDRMGYKEGEVIQHSMITKSIERAQKKVEENNFGIRKRLLEYDDVMNSQREVIYKRRNHALYGERLSVDIDNTFQDIVEDVVIQHHENRDYEEFKLDMFRSFSMDPEITEDELINGKPAKLSEDVYRKVMEAYKRKSENICKIATPVLDDIFKNKGETVENIVVPFTDGKKVVQVVTNLKEACESKGTELIKSFEKSISLVIIDDLWKEHLRQMDELKQSVQSAVYEQKDPLLIYKFEAFELFKQMIGSVNHDISSFLIKGTIPIEKEEDVTEASTPQKADYSNMQAGRENTKLITNPDAARAQPPDQQPDNLEPVRVGKKVGRNEPCPCGSGRKYKHCHGGNS